MSKNTLNTSQPTPAVSLPEGVAPVNHLTIARKSGPVTGNYVVRPDMQMPENVLVPPGAEEGGVRPNLRLASDDGTVDADVWIVRPPEADGDGAAASPTRLIFQGLGPVGVRLHALGAAPCLVDATSLLQGVALTLPRDFAGLVMTSTTRGNATQVPSSFKTLSEVGGEGRFFVGDTSQIGPNGWTGTTVKINAPHGGIKVVLENVIPWKKVAVGAAVIFSLLLMARGAA